MKKQILITTLLIGHVVFASPGVTDTADMPFQYPDRCTEKKSIVLPSSQEGTAYYFNRDCSVAYIVPPPTGEVQISKPAMFTNMRLCPSLDVNLKLVEKLQRQLLNLVDVSLDPKASQLKRDEATTQITMIQGLLDSEKGKYDKYAALTMQMNFKSSLTPEYMKEINSANMPLIERGEIKIRPAPIQKSYLTFNARFPSADTYIGNPVLESNIVGILSRADESQTDRSSVVFNGAAQGFVTLNLSGACQIVSGDFEHPNDLKLDPAAAANFLSVTNTMMVPLISSFGYKAEFNVDNATRTLFEKSGTKTQFTSTEMTHLLLDGDASEAFKVTSWSFEAPNGEMQTQLVASMTPENISAIRESMVAQYVSRLMQFNVLREVKPLETPADGNAVQTGVRQECWSSSSWFGLSRSSGCRDVTYEFLVHKDGTSQQQADINNQIKLDFSETVEMLRPITRTHTGIFKIKAGSL